MKKILIAVLSGILVVIFLLGFVDIANEVPTQNKEVFTYSITTIPRELKAIGSLNKREQDIVCATSRGLVELDKDSKIVPSLAESVDVKEDGIEYDFKIRDNIYWSNGEKITAKDIANFFREVLAEEKEENITALLDVYGAKTFRSGEGIFTKDVGIQTAEDRITIRLNSKNTNFLNELSKPQYRVRKDLVLWEDISENFKNVIYSGEYSITSMDMSEIVLTRNSKADLNIVEAIHIIEDEGEELAMAAFEVGNRDIVVGPPKSQLTRLEEEGRLVTTNSDLAMYLAFNPNGSSLPMEGKKEIYSLINKAIGEYQLQNNILLELAEGSYFRDDKDDLAKLQARKVMSNTETKWKKVEEIVLIAEESAGNKELCNFLTQWFIDNSEISLTYKLINKSELGNLHNENYYNVALIQCEASLNNKKILYDKVINFLPKDYSKNLEDVKKEEEKNTMFTSMEENLFNTYSVLPLLFYNENIAISEKIKNVALDGNGNIYFDRLEK
ncbi:ABC transporter substrate-binding protein [Clostridium gasigenes]|uniref:ABC transporter substrate-binding protein n=1 Tax=Clostridium gasigenes TaxID=94869 RepID=UPI001C0AEB60|nr:ABC transporter substrate-binding protein [Clostridium gasigenes]MBU3104694.1 peptide ABC transporter substrate-binding protein [Clostridium gasigenes]